MQPSFRKQSTYLLTFACALALLGASKPHVMATLPPGPFTLTATQPVQSAYLTVLDSEGKPLVRIMCPNNDGCGHLPWKDFRLTADGYRCKWDGETLSCEAKKK